MFLIFSIIIFIVQTYIASIGPIGIQNTAVKVPLKKENLKETDKEALQITTNCHRTPTIKKNITERGCYTRSEVLLPTAKPQAGLAGETTRINSTMLTANETRIQTATRIIIITGDTTHSPLLEAPLPLFGISPGKKDFLDLAGQQWGWLFSIATPDYRHLKSLFKIT